MHITRWIIRRRLNRQLNSIREIADQLTPEQKARLLGTTTTLDKDKIGAS